MAEALPAIRREVLAEVLRQLQWARESISELLAQATSADAARRYARQLAEINRILAGFGQHVTEAAQAGAGQAWAAAQGEAMAEAGQPGIAFRLNPRTLLATRHMLTDRITNVTDVARRQINTALTQHLLGVRSLSQAISDIQEILDGAPRRRAMTIAYTEISRVYNAAHYESLLEIAKSVPGLKKAWLHSKKEHGRPGHIRASQQEPIPVAEPFEIFDKKSGTAEALRFPGDPEASAGNTINCGCMMKAVFPKPEELEDDGYRPLKPEDMVQPGTVWIDGVRQPPGTPSGIPVAAPRAPAAPAPMRMVQDAGGILPPLGPPGGGGGGPPDDPSGALVAAALRGLEARVAQVGGRRVLARLWTSLDSYAVHVERRMRAGHVADAAVLAERTLEVLAATPRVQVALDPAGLRSSLKFQVTPTGWIVILDGEGRIVTSYPFDPDRPGFVEWNIRSGFDIHDYTLTPSDREMLARLFGRR